MTTNNLYIDMENILLIHVLSVFIEYADHIQQTNPADYKEIWKHFLLVLV